MAKCLYFQREFLSHGLAQMFTDLLKNFIRVYKCRSVAYLIIDFSLTDLSRRSNARQRKRRRKAQWRKEF